MRRALPTRSPARIRAALACALLLLLPASGCLLASARPALALSEIKREDEQPSTAPSGDTIEEQTLPPVEQVPIPDATTPAPAEPGQPDEAQPPADQGTPDVSEPDNPDAPLPEVIYDLGRLPEPVRQMHDRLIEACKSGDIEKLRPLIGTGENGTQLSFESIDGDPIAYLKELSGDKQGAEVLAILEEVLSAGYVHLDPGSANDMYVWPYFYGVPLERLTPAQKVELFKLVTAGDYEDMKTYGSYIFYRVGITPDGRWSFFVAGD
jgi:hypothetical protein